MLFAALLRAVNAGPASRVSMATLRSALDEHGLPVVATYLQSGNLVLDAPRTTTTHVAERLEAVVAGLLQRRTPAVVLTTRQLATIVADAPAAWREPSGIGASGWERRVVLGTRRVRVGSLLGDLVPDGGTETIESRHGVLYWAVRVDALSHSALAPLARRAVYQELTVRSYPLMTGFAGVVAAALRARATTAAGTAHAHDGPRPR